MRKIPALSIMAVLALVLLSPSWGFSEEAIEDNKKFDGIEEIIKILEDKGVIEETEAAALIRRYNDSMSAGDSKEEANMGMPEDKVKETAVKIADEIAQPLREDIETIKSGQSDMSREILRQSIQTEDEFIKIDERITDDINIQLQKSSWAQRIEWGGDIRLRVQKDMYDEDNAYFLDPADATKILNSTVDRSRGVFRLRLDATADILQKKDPNVGEVEAGVRVTSGTITNPVSTNETMGDYNNKDSLVLDRAYLKYTYKPVSPIAGHIPQLQIAGGRIPNPWFSTDLVWDNDLNFEGVALGIASDTLLSNPWTISLTLGAFPLQEEDYYEDKWLYGAQLCVEYKKPMGLSAKLGAARYDYKKTLGKINSIVLPGYYDYTSPLTQQKGNTLFDIDPSDSIKTALASEFRELNVTGRLVYDRWYPNNITLTADYVKNLGFDRVSVAGLTGYSDIKDQTKGYQIGLSAGYAQIRDIGDWGLSLNYKYLEADSVVDSFTESDFHTGGTNARGWIFGTQFGILKDVWLSLNWMTSDQIYGSKFSVDTFQFDISARF